MDGMKGSLLDEIERLEERGYACMFLMQEGLAPLTGQRPWRMILEHIVDREVNILCGQRVDPHFERVIRAYARDARVGEFGVAFLRGSPARHVWPESRITAPMEQQFSAVLAGQGGVPPELLRTIGDRFFFGDEE